MHLINQKCYLNNIYLHLKVGLIKVNKKIRLLGAVLQFSAALNARQRSLVETISITESKEALTFKVLCEQSALAEKVQAEKQKQLERVLKRILTCYLN